MKIFKKTIAILMLAAMALALSLSAFAAIDVRPGKTAAVTFSIPGIYGIDGYFEFSNGALFSSVEYRNNSSMMGNVSSDGVYLYGSSKTDVKIEIKLTVSAKAAPGDKCDITFHYETSDENGDMSDWKTLTQTVVVKQEEATTEEQTKEPVTDPVTEPPVTEPEIVINYKELENRIRTAESLEANDYTKSSWDSMLAVLESARSIRESEDQAAVDASARSLASAIEALVTLDYSNLNRAIEDAHDIENKYVQSDLMFELFDKIGTADEVKASRDQQKADRLADEINALIVRIKEDEPEKTTDTEPVTEPKEIIKEVIKYVDVLPEGDYCNVSGHKLWPVLFFVSLAISLMLGAIIAVYLIKRKKLRKDDTPIVDYNIEDDE